MNIYSREQRAMIEATIFNMLFYAGGVSDPPSWQAYVDMLTDKELEIYFNETIHRKQNAA